METSEIVEKLVSNKIIRDLEQVNELTIVSKDPIGYAVYLYFLLKNKIRNVEVENLIDWMNSWVESILVQQNFSKFIDRELASSLFAFFSLKTFDRLSVKVENDSLKKLFSEYIEEAHFFSNFTLSTLIAVSLAEFKEEIEEYPNLIAWIKKQVEEKSIFNDAKNVVFASMLFEQLDTKDYLKKVFDYCYERLQENNIPYYDELFYAHVLWKFRSFKEKKEDLQKIREFAEESIENAKRDMLKEEDESVKEIYGADTQKVSSKISASKIYLGVFIDLVKDFEHETVRVAKEELTRKDFPRWISLGPLISIIILVASGGISWLAFQLNAFIKAWLVADPFLVAIGQLVIGGVLFVFVMVLLVTGGSILWDIVYKRICIPKVIKDNLKCRLKNYVWLEVALPVFLGILRIFFGV